MRGLLWLRKLKQKIPSKRWTGWILVVGVMASGAAMFQWWRGLVGLWVVAVHVIAAVAFYLDERSKIRDGHRKE